MFLCLLKNYKQLSYIAKLAMVATVIALIAIVADSLVQILVFLKIEYTAGDQSSQLNIAYQSNAETSSIHFLMPLYPNFLDCFVKIQVSFEGAPMVPRLYTNAKNKHYFVRNLNRAILAMGVI